MISHEQHVTSYSKSTCEEQVKLIMVDSLVPPGGLGGKKPSMLGGGIYFKRCIDYGSTVVKMLEVRIKLIQWHTTKWALIKKHATLESSLAAR